MKTIEYRVFITVESEDMDLDDLFGAALQLDEEALSSALGAGVSIDFDRVGVLPLED